MEDDMSECKAVLNLRGEHFQCEVDAPHDGWGHSFKAAEAIWLGSDEAEMQKPIGYLHGVPVYISEAYPKNRDGSFRRNT
jgi:hypothetical protein